ncbi:MAG: GxxExxY protein [Desulfuromonadaceae bacterium]|nr:GxxExxY protein [Desulfuromonadaceae bacterium]MDD2854372.1 GxxExxY protein [Desulfuromonadaceae bacterium]
MNADTRREKLDLITEAIIGCCYTVISKLGSGFLEKVYENALGHEIRKAGLKALQQYPVKVVYDGVEVGDYIADILVDDQILIELKAVRALDNIHRAQCLNYLKATGYKICLLVNFGDPKLEVKRIVLDY